MFIWAVWLFLIDHSRDSGERVRQSSFQNKLNESIHRITFWGGGGGETPKKSHILKFHTFERYTEFLFCIWFWPQTFCHANVSLNGMNDHFDAQIQIEHMKTLCAQNFTLSAIEKKQKSPSISRIRNGIVFDLKHP